MSRKKKEELPTPKELYDSLFACINCVYEGKCDHILPFPLNLCEKCDEYEKIIKHFE
jgi:hypothetical protein